jgi:hypothetical protein
MAFQFRSESRGGIGQCPARLACLLLIFLLGVAACNASEPTEFQPNVPFDPQGPARSGGGGNTTSSSDIVGTWERTDIFSAGGDILTQTTTWEFDSGGFCVRTIRSLSALEGIPRITERSCTWSLSTAEITITLGGSTPAVFDVGFAAFDPNRLLLDGYEYARIE